MPTLMPAKIEISDTYPNPSDAVARAGFAKLWDYIATLYGKENIKGVVSQAAGIPTGALIERGSNANGEFVRFADGLQICHFNKTGPGDRSFAYGVLYYGVLGFVFPAVFIAQPVVSTSQIPSTFLAWSTTNSVTTTGVSIMVVDAFSRVDAGLPTSCIAIGRWY